MKISGFTMVRNAGKLYYPVKACIESLLPLVDEFIVALGEGDPDDDTLQQIESIGSDKIRIYHRVWDEALFKDGAIFREETTFALQQCTGDWCIYLQADEVIHEEDLPKVKAACEKYLDDKEVEGMLISYHHFFGDYEHEVISHGWCAHEIRIVRNGLGAQSYKDAISFRIDNRKMKVAEIDVPIYHYGWVRPPELMTKKRNLQHDMHHGKDGGEAYYTQDLFQYGPLGRLDKFHGTHPKVMTSWLSKFNWSHQLNYTKQHRNLNRALYKHEKPKYRILNFIEKNFNNRRQIFTFTNWVTIRK
ncbi:MAG: hypothetical protein JSS76_02535 [Bacteroidetes bacterium]|nr:hypothetical protein [Bacteroidota bacterium]MBS1683602.1 hypothetical protein [Bacteroidota bacterium]